MRAFKEDSRAILWNLNSALPQSNRAQTRSLPASIIDIMLNAINATTRMESSNFMALFVEVASYKVSDEN